MEMFTRFQKQLHACFSWFNLQFYKLYGKTVVVSKLKQRQKKKAKQDSITLVNFAFTAKCNK